MDLIPLALTTGFFLLCAALALAFEQNRRRG